MAGRDEYPEFREVAIVGTETGDTNVIFMEILFDRNLMEFLRQLTTNPESPVRIHDQIWIPPPSQLETALRDLTGKGPNQAQIDFLYALGNFLLDLYQPFPVYFRPGTLYGANTHIEADHGHGRRIAAYFRLTRQEPAPQWIRDDMWEFAFYYLCSLG